MKKQPTKTRSKLAPDKAGRTDSADLKLNGHAVSVTHLHKVFWPEDGYTKGDLINYYRSVSKYILPYLKDRPESMNRHPNGIDEPGFFQKDVDHQPPPWAKTKRIFSESEEKGINYLLCQDEATLVYMANLGCIEINPWNSTTAHLDNPDYLVIDLDPEKIDFKYVVQTALVVHKILDKAGAKNFCKTSGATGLHIYVPLGAKYDYEHAKDFAKLIALLANHELPDITSVERSPKKRQHKIYLDFLQNRRGQTLASAYSVRPRPGATVSTPLDWKELTPKLKPTNFNIKNTPARLKKVGDLWKPVLGPGIDMQKCLKKLGA